MNTTTQIDLSRLAIVAVLRGNYYISIRSGAILRWANKVTGREYHTLTTRLWTKAGFAEKPEGSIKPTSNVATYYFAQEADALEALSMFVDALVAKGIKV